MPIVDTISSTLLDLKSGKGIVAARYLAVSVINVANHQVLLYLAHSIWGWPAGWANVFAAVLAAGPAYFLSRKWVWEIEGPHSWKTEVVPFWMLALLGLVVSTVLAWVAKDGLMVNVASLAGYFLVWLAKFFLLDRIFGLTPESNDG